jgi:hypothetical protein
MLNVIKLSVIMLSSIMLVVVLLSVIVTKAAILSLIVLSTILLKLIMINMPSAIMINMPSAIMMIVIYTECHYAGFLWLTITMMRAIMSKVVIFSVIRLKVNLLSTFMTNVVYACECH